MNKLRLGLYVVAAIVAVSFLIAVIVPAVYYYRSVQRTAYDEVAALSEPLDKLKEVWKEGGELTAVQGTLEQKNQEIAAAVAAIRTTDDRQVIASRLETISANLSFIGQVLKNEKGKGADAVKEMETKVAALKAKVAPPDSLARFSEVTIRELGVAVLASIWSLLPVLLAIYLIRSESARKGVRDLFKGFKSFKAGPTGLEVEMAVGEEVKVKTEETLAGIRDTAKNSYNWWALRKNIRPKVERVVEDVAKHFAASGKELPAYRCTVHVPDLVFDDALYQLLDYLPVGGGGGRVFSVRFGIIGKVWRMREPETRGDVPRVTSGAVDETRLVQEWGMTRPEAQRAGRDRPSFLCVPLFDKKQEAVGIFYMDSEEADAFEVPGAAGAEPLHELIRARCMHYGLTAELAVMREELSLRASLIRIYGR